MALPPCHGVAIQFFVRNGDTLDLQIYQRSADVCLGLPYNITSYSLMLLMYAHCTGKKPGKLAIVLGDAHVYAEHFEPAKIQLTNQSYPFPQIRIKNGVQHTDPAQFELEDFVVTDYKHSGPIKYKFVV